MHCYCVLFYDITSLWQLSQVTYILHSYCYVMLQHAETVRIKFDCKRDLNFNGKGAVLIHFQFANDSYYNFA